MAKKRCGMIGVAVVMLAGLMCQNVRADDRRALAEELISVKHMQKNTEDAIVWTKQMMSTQFKNAAKSMGQELPASFAAAQEKILNLVTSEMSWDKMKDDYVSSFVDTYTAEELKGQIDFYKTPIGQAIVAKEPEFTKKIMQISQKRMMDLMPRIQAMAKEAMPKPAPAPAPTPAPAKPPVKE